MSVTNCDSIILFPLFPTSPPGEGTAVARRGGTGVRSEPSSASGRRLTGLGESGRVLRFPLSPGERAEGRGNGTHTPTSLSPALRPHPVSARLTHPMQSKAITVRQYLAELSAERRSAIKSVRAVILKNLDPVFEEGMQYGMIGYYVPHRVYPPGYHCDPKQPLPFICLASQKNYMSLYLGCVYGPSERERRFREAWAKTGGKLDMGKSCVRFRKLDDLALEVIGESIRRVTARGFIEYYQSVLKETSRRPARSAATKSTGTKPKKRVIKSAHAKRRLR